MSVHQTPNRRVEIKGQACIVGENTEQNGALDPGSQNVKWLNHIRKQLGEFLAT